MASAVFRYTAGVSRHRGAGTTALISSAPAAGTAMHRIGTSLSLIRSRVVATNATVPPTTSLFLNTHLLHARIPSSSSRSLATASTGVSSVATAAGVAAPPCEEKAVAAELTSAAECGAVIVRTASMCNIGRISRYENMLSIPSLKSRRCFSSTAAGAQPSQQILEKKQGGEESSSPSCSPTLEGRYAGALLRAAKQSNQLQAVYEEMVNMKELLQQSEDFKRFIETPALSTSQKETLLQQLGSTYQLQPITVNLLQMLLENKRMTLLGKVVDAFEILYRKEKGEIRCLITSAQPLNSQQQKEVIAALQKRAGPRAKLMLDYAVNPQLMGGLVVRLGDQVLDFSVATRIDRLQAQLMAPL